jgi:hypothetical protein
VNAQAETVLISRYCPTCKGQIKAWRMERIDGRWVEHCIDCDGIDLTEIRETVGKLDS